MGYNTLPVNEVTVLYTNADKNKKNRNRVFLCVPYLPDFLAVITHQYTNPGTRPTMSGIQTSQPANGLAISK